MRKITPRVERLEPKCLLAASHPAGLLLHPAAAADRAPAGVTAAVGPDPSPSQDGPVVLEIQRFGFHAQRAVVSLRFSQPLDPATALNPSNYFFRNFKSRPVPVASV